MPTRNLSSSEIRRQFLDYFEARGHRVIPSSSLIPHGDPTLLFTNAGMIQFKPYFLGQATPPQPRATTAQKCFRTGDIEEVGRNHRSLTFFEMLGNFSFGDYFKDQAIATAFELVTHGFGLPAERIWATVHTDDDEAYDLWLRETSIPPERLSRFGDEYNFWAPGPTGPCGPNSEINYDWGPEYGCGRRDCGPNCEHCERFLEIWNLVFIQYDRDGSGNRTSLDRPGIDTGMGLERMAAVLNGKPDVFETDLFRPILEHVGFDSTNYPEREFALRVVADHSRGATMLAADGVLPSNEGRGYVLRRLIRRGSVHTARLASATPLSTLVPVVAQILGPQYPEVLANRDHIQKTIRGEEEHFAVALRQGMEKVHGFLERGVLTPQQAFYLHDTLGFPMELTAELARERGVQVDVAAAQALMERQRAQSRRSSTFAAPSVASATRFLGHQQLEAESQVAEIHAVPQQPDQADVYFPESPFYAERGGQAADRGWLEWDGQRAAVVDAQAQGEAIRHRVQVAVTALAPGQRVLLGVDGARRAAVARHHSATHLVHQALREVLGEQAKQAGSMVLPDYATFDFRFPRALSEGERTRVAEVVNLKVRENLVRRVEEMPLEQAIKSGAVALFDEAYGESVRVVSFGDWSRELCGGTHVERSGQIGLALISTDRSIGAGVRRIELRAGAAAEERVRLYEQTIERLAEALKSTPQQLPAKVEGLQAEVHRLHRELMQARQKLATASSGAADAVEQIAGIPVAIRKVEADELQLLRLFADAALDRLPNPGVAVMLGGRHVVVKVAAPLVPRGFDAGKICRAVATAAGGRGGGKPEVAEGGGLQPDRSAAAFEQARASIRAMAGRA